MPSTSSRGNKRLSISGRRKRTKNTGETSDAGLNSMEGIMPRVAPCSCPEESIPWLGLHLGPGQ